MSTPRPVATAHLLPDLHRRLVELLRRLEPRDWTRPTVAGGWTVKDVTAHLLDVQVRRLSLQRDGHEAPLPGRDLSDYRTLVAFLDELNAGWVAAMARTSPRVLVDLLDVVGPQCADLLQGLDPEGPALFPVAWAGEDASRNWFDVGRDYTELWHHQAQIRMATDAPLLEERRWLHPVLAVAVRALPRALRGVVRPPGSALVLDLTGDAGGTWSAVAGDGVWRLQEGGVDQAAARLVLPAGVAWRLFFNAIPAEAARDEAEGMGDGELLDAALSLRSVMV